MSDFFIETVLNQKNVKSSIYRYRKEKIEGMCPFEYWKQCGKDILNDIYADQYRPVPMRCFFIRKVSGGKRMITVPTTLDKILQRATAIELERYYRSRFSEYSFAFRKGVTKVEALNACLTFLDGGYEYVIRLDIKNYFDTISRNVLKDILLDEIEDGRIVSWIMRIVNSPINLEGIPVRQKNGISQGSPLSPCLANIYLNELDAYMDSYAMNYVRYADDILVFCKTYKEAEELLDVCKLYLNKELMLEINTEKTAIEDAYCLDFLGFMFVKERYGYSIAISENKQKKQYAKINEIYKQGTSTDIEMWQKIGAINRGWTNYYQIVPEYNIMPILQKLDESQFKQMLKCTPKIRDEIFKHANFTLNEVWYREREYQKG